MADSTSHLDLLVPGQLQDEVTMNALFDAMSPAMAFSRRESKSGYLAFTISVGRYLSVAIDEARYVLTASTTTYATLRRSDGQVAFSTDITNWNDAEDYRRLYLIVTDAVEVTSWQDHRFTQIVE